MRGSGEMNDFTKEELEILSEYIDYPIQEIIGTEGNRLKLASKIQSLIDNYCEHLGDDRDDNNFCNKCQRQVI